MIIIFSILQIRFISSIWDHKAKTLGSTCLLNCDQRSHSSRERSRNICRRYFRNTWYFLKSWHYQLSLIFPTNIAQPNRQNEVVVTGRQILHHIRPDSQSHGCLSSSTSSPKTHHIVPDLFEMQIAQAMSSKSHIPILNALRRNRYTRQRGIVGWA